MLLDLLQKTGKRETGWEDLGVHHLESAVDNEAEEILWFLHLQGTTCRDLRCDWSETAIYNDELATTRVT